MSTRPDSADLSASSLRATLEINEENDLANIKVWTAVDLLWKSGDTKKVVHALEESQINAHSFIAEILCRVFTSVLGETPRVLGDYDTSLSPKVQQDRTVQISWKALNVVKVLTQCAFLAPPPESGPWAHVYQAPNLGRWSEALPNLDSSESTMRAVAEVLHEANDHGLDMDYVVARCVHALPSGVLGLGQNAEARAFVFCRISSAYAYEKDVLQFTPSHRTLELLASVDAMSEPLRRALLRQMYPILELMSRRDPPHDSSTASDVTTAISATEENTRLGIPPFWLFLVDCAEATDAVWSQLEPLFLSLWHRYKHITLPATAVPVMTLIGWVLIGYRSSSPATSGTMDRAREPKQLHWGSSHLSWIFSARIADVDGCLKIHSAFHVARAWAKSRRPFMKNLAVNVHRFKPEAYQGHVYSIANTMIDLIKQDVVTEGEGNSFWLRLVALCGGYTDAFEHALLEHATRRVAETVFSGIITSLTPFPTAAQRTSIKALQETYSAAADMDKRTLPAHLADQFIVVSIGLARRKTALAQALQDAGIVTLFTAIREGVYEYPDAPDLVPPGVRAIVRQQMCADALGVLSDRLEM